MQLDVSIFSALIPKLIYKTQVNFKNRQLKTHSILVLNNASTLNKMGFVAVNNLQDTPPLTNLLDDNDYFKFTYLLIDLFSVR